jgi:hypothetical protein
MPGVSRHHNLNPVTAFAANNVKRTANAVDGLVENKIILKGIGPDDVIIVCIFCPPDNAGGAVRDPAMALNFTSMKPSSMLVSFFRSSG